VCPPFAPCNFAVLTDPFYFGMPGGYIAGGVGQVWGSARKPLPRTRRATGMLELIGAGVAGHNSMTCGFP
jgi:hypothetical protein